MDSSFSRPETSAQYRLRFLLQEFNLPAGITLIGRSAECQITLFDPSVSRHHARIVVDDHRAVIEDLGSRNGCRVNGLRIHGSHVLAEGDRIRIGTQELVFGTETGASHVQSRSTGSICFCSSCRSAYAREMDGCPSCGSTARRQAVPAELEDETAGLPL